MAYCASVEQGLVSPEPDAGVASLVDALEKRLQRRSDAMPAPAAELLQALESTQGHDQDVWRRVAAAMQCSRAICSESVATVLPYAHDHKVPLLPLVHALTSLLHHCRPSQLWDTNASTRRLPLPVLTSVLENPALDTVGPELLFPFFALFLDSVHAYTAQAYDHSLKMVMHYLLEGRQHAHEPEALRKRHRVLGALLVERQVAAAMEETLHPHASPSARVNGNASVCTVLDLYATQLLREGAANTRLLRPIGLALAHDALKAANTCLALPAAAKHVQSLRRTFAQSAHVDRNTDERLYTQAQAEYGALVQGPTIAASLWRECALALCSEEPTPPALGVYFLRAVSHVALFFPAPVAAALAPKQVVAESEADAFSAFAAQMLAAVVQTRLAMATIAESCTTASRQDARTAWDAVLAKCADLLPFLYASESPAIRSSSLPTTDVDSGTHFSRFETLHGQFLESANAAASGVDRFLRTYLLVAEHIPSALHGAYPFLETLDDLLHVFCDLNIGLFLPFVAWNPAEESVLADDGDPMPVPLRLWSRSSQTLALLFQQVPHWSRSAAREELLAWLPRVPALASFMVKRTSIVVAALEATGKPGWGANEAISVLAMPLNSAIGWLRLNQKELLQELSDYVRRTVQAFSKASMPLPPKVTQHAVDFLTQQLDVAEGSVRKTLLSTAQLELLLDEFLALPKTRTETHTPTPAALRQQTLAFASKPGVVVDLTADDAPRPNPFRAAAQTMRTPKPASKPAPGPTTRLSQLRSEFQSTRNTARRPHAPSRALEPDEPRGPLAVSSVSVPVAPAPRRVAKPESDSDTSSSEEEASGLGALASPRKAVKTLPPARRSVVMMDDSALQKTMRKARDDSRVRRLRSPPDYDELHRCILAWDMSTTSDEVPPHTSAVLSSHAEAVPLTFATSDEYIRVFGALFLKECWAQFQQAKEALSAQDLLPISLSVGGSVNELVRLDCQVRPPPKWSVTDADIVCLESDGEHDKVQLLGKVQNVDGRGKALRVSILCHPNTPGKQRAVKNAGSTAHSWHIAKLFSLVTLRREYAALLSIPDVALREDILQARVAKKADVSDADVASTVRRFGVNAPQAYAILGAMRTPGFSLIQGPPGTGKTKTISALVATFLQRRRGTSVSASKASSKMLLCAPSNAAIDEIVVRIQEGVMVDGRLIQPRLVRLGREDAVNPAVRASTLEAAVERRQHQRQDSAMKQQAARQRLQKIEQAWTEKEQLLAQTTDKVVARQLQAELNLLTDQRLEAREERESLARSEKSTASMEDARRHHVRVAVVDEAEIVCATLAGAGHDLLYPLEFDTVVIDEAVQAVELSALIPLRYNAQRCIMVGDPKQLPPTVISQSAERLGYAQSLFVRMYKQTPQSVYLLSIQYRMHPHISLFPSTAFYEGQLLDGDDMAERTVQPWHALPLFGPFRMLDVGSAREETGRGHSLINRAEADTAMALYDALARHTKQPLAGRVGFITMYKAQVALLRSAFRTRFGVDAMDDAAFNTVDGFQGQEKDIIILSCVRSNARNTIGFLGDQRRLNVALTRARSNMFVIGDAAMLQRADPVWDRMVTEAAARGYLVPVRSDTFRFPARGQHDARAVHERKRSPPLPSTQTPRPGGTAAKAKHARPGPKGGQTPLPLPAKPVHAPPRAPAPPVRGSPPKKQRSAAPPAILPAKPKKAPEKRAATRASPPPAPGKWAAIVARSKEKPTTPRSVPVTPGDARPKPKPSESGPSWLRPSRPTK